MRQSVVARKSLGRLPSSEVSFLTRSEWQHFTEIAGIGYQRIAALRPQTSSRSAGWDRAQQIAQSVGVEQVGGLQRSVGTDIVKCRPHSP
jgi:hypothetical protein